MKCNQAKRTNHCEFVSSEWCSYQHLRRIVSWENSYHHRTYGGHLPSVLHDCTEVWRGTAKVTNSAALFNLLSIKFWCFAQEFKWKSYFEVWRTRYSGKKSNKNNLIKTCQIKWVFSQSVLRNTAYCIFEFSLRISQQQWQTATWQASHLWLFAWFSPAASVAHWLAKEAQRSKRSERYFPFILSSRKLFLRAQTGTESLLPGALTP